MKISKVMLYVGFVKKKYEEGEVKVKVIGKDVKYLHIKIVI